MVGITGMYRVRWRPPRGYIHEEIDYQTENIEDPISTLHGMTRNQEPAPQIDLGSPIPNKRGSTLISSFIGGSFPQPYFFLFLLCPVLFFCCSGVEFLRGISSFTMYDIHVPSQFGPATVRIGLPPASLLNFPPSSRPETIPAPQATEFSWKQPFNIPPGLYTQLLDVRVPITIATVYALTVVVINRINKSRGYKPYGFSHSRLFKLFVVLHNVFLAIYSAWTCVGMFQAFGNSWADRGDPNGLAGIVDALCKINGPRGYGNAATFNPRTEQWSIPNSAFKLTNGLPDPTDAGRLWNQGLAYLGWIFYLSKFYEVVDTAIILAKGKKSSTLQTYHHAGAMMCMWAGIRYMAAPIWIFCLVNSGIHAMMVCTSSSLIAM